MDFKAVTPKYDEEDAHIVRRLGWAVVAQWHALPAEVRERLKDQAVFVSDNHHTVQLEQQIDQFISKHAKGP